MDDDARIQTLNSIASTHSRYLYWKQQIEDSNDESQKQSHRVKAAIEKKMLIALIQGFVELLDAD
jgi:hypothetical protein